MDEPSRPRARRVDAGIRRGLILDAAEALLAEHDPLLVTFEEVAEAAGVSRALVHRHLGDRRGLHDAVQVRVITRLDRWVAHGLDRARDTPQRCRALVLGTWSFVEAETGGWSVLGVTGGFDHPAMHGLRTRWAATLADEPGPRRARAGFAVAGLIGGIGSWVHGGVDPDDLVTTFEHTMDPAPGP